MSRADELYKATCRDILENGFSDENLEVRPHWSDGTPAHTVKKFGVVNRYNLAEEFPIMTLRRTALKSATDEILWIWQQKSNNIHDLRGHIWDSWADENGSIGKAYGYQLAVKHQYPEGEMDQVDRVLYDLKHNPASRRILTNIYNFEDLHEMNLYPCAYSMTFNVSGHTLNAILNQRSQDMLTANNWNVVQYAVLLHMIAQVCGMEVGELVHVIADAHIYDRHVPIIEKLLEQDEHPRDYDAELEDEEEEAAPTSEKRLKREIRAEALKRLEEAARTESDFLTVVDEWNKLDRNRERRERDHENLRGDVPLEFQAVPDPKIAPLWMNLPRFRQLCQGNFLDIIFSCPYELHELTANRFLSKLFFTLSDEQKEVLYYLFVKQYRTTRLAAIRGQSDRNIRKLRMTIQKKLQKRMYEHLSEKLENDHGLTLREREFVEEYEALLQTMGKDAVIRRENKTKPRKKKTALDDVKDG